MEWASIFGLMVGNAALIIPLWLWNRAESRADHRHLEATMTCMMNGIRDEMKDFHGRLCALEEKNRR